MSKAYIMYKKGGLYPYAVYIGKDWPYGTLVEVYMTRWGARRAMKQAVKEPEQYESVIIERWERSND
jgi:hypothetical protein